MLFILSKLVDPLVLPGNFLILVLAVGAVLLALGRRRAGGALVGFVAIAMVAIMVLPVEDWVGAPLEDRFPVPQLPARIDGIVLLGGAIRMPMTQLRGTTALNGMAERMTSTLALALHYPGVPVVVSGGSAAILPHGISEAEAMKQLLVSDGLAPGRIVIEDRSRNTYENAVYSKEVAHPQPGQVWLLVTSADHMPRAVGCFRHVGWEMLPYPVGFYSGVHATFGFNFDATIEPLGWEIHEWIGLVSYRLLGRIDSVLPGPS